MTKKIFKSILIVAGTVLLASIVIIMAACMSISAIYKRINWRMSLI